MKEEYTYNPSVWAEEQNKTYRQQNMIQGFTVDVIVGQEYGIKMGEQRSLTAHYIVSHPDYGELSKVWTVFNKDKSDKDNLADIAKEWAPIMEEELNRDLTDKL